MSETSVGVALWHRRVAMTSADVSIERHEGHLATVTVHRPPYNYADIALVGAIADAYQELERDGARAVVLRSEGRHFCAGADFTGASEAEPVTADGAAELYAQAARLFETGLPVVAAVQGAAVGAGAGLALSADMRVGCESTRFVFNFSTLGIHHGFGITVTLPLVVGPQRALDLLLTGRPCRGAETLTVGLCDRFVDDADRLYDEAIELARQIAAAAPLATRSIRATLRGGLAEQFRAATAHECAEQHWLRATTDHQEAIRALAARETPVFTGR